MGPWTCCDRYNMSQATMSRTCTDLGVARTQPHAAALASLTLLLPTLASRIGTKKKLLGACCGRPLPAAAAAAADQAAVHLVLA
jgi:hypothetical protein